MNGVSVIVCCFNSAERIGETLQFLYSQKFTMEIPWEIIFVNNASNDNTIEVIDSFKRSCNQPIVIKVVEEPTPGLAFARKKGLHNATYDLLIFCDDDNHLDEYYIQKAFQMMIEHSDVGIAGGWVKPKLPFYPGKWIDANFGALAIGKQGEEAGYKEWVYGAGMVIKKKIFRDLESRGIELMLSGRQGTRQTSGDDAEMCHLSKFIGYKIYYSPSLVVHHRISSNRLTRWSFVKANYKNVFHVVYFFILDNLIKRCDAENEQVYLDFIRSRFSNLSYFLPRIFFGKNNFYSFMMFFQNLQLIVWLFWKKKYFTEIFHRIKMNLYHDSAG